MEGNIVSAVWHFKIEDNLSWNFCAGMLKCDGITDITGQQLKSKFKKYFKNLVGIAPYQKCPVCGKELLPRKSQYGFFVGCSDYPSCKFMATDKKPYMKQEKKANDK